jgi:hypothetical protein
VLASPGVVPLRSRAAGAAPAAGAGFSIPVGPPRATVPGDPLEITFAPLHVLAFEPSGDDVVQCWWRWTDPWSSSGMSPEAALHEQRAIQDAFPRAQVLVVAATRPPSETLPVAVVDLMRSGRQEIALEPVPLASFRAPELVDCSTFAGEPLQEVTLRLLDHEHRPVGADVLQTAFRLTQDGDAFGPRSFFADERGTCHVPDGSYRVVTTFDHLARTFSTSPTVVTPPGSVDITLSVPLRRCSLAYVAPWGEPVTGVDWKIQTSLGQVRLRTSGTDPARALLPVGDAMVFAQAFGVPTEPYELEVLPGPIDDAQEVRIVPPQTRER